VLCSGLSDLLGLLWAMRMHAFNISAAVRYFKMKNPKAQPAGS